MGSRALLWLRPPATAAAKSLNFKSDFFSRALTVREKRVRSYSVRSGLEPPDLPRLAETARISLTPDEVEEFAPKIRQVVDWFGQLQAVDLQSIRPAIRAVVLKFVAGSVDTEGENLRDDSPETFENREAMIATVPNYKEPFIKVPKVLNKE